MKNNVLKLIKYLYYFSLIALFILYLFPGSLIGYLLYEDLGKQPNLVDNPIGTSINHLFCFMYLTTLAVICNLKQNEIFSEGIIKRIFLTKNGEVDLVTNSTLTKNFLILSIKTEFKNLNKSSSVFEKYEAKARLNLINKIYKTFDDQLNSKYKVVINQKTIDRVKNSF